MQTAPTRLTHDEFVEQYPRETESIEFKSGTGLSAIQDAIVALSNTAGGQILVGVANDGAVRGRRLDQGTEEQINEAALAAHDVGRYAVRPMRVGTTDITVIDVQRRAQGFAQTSDGRTLVRRGPRNHALLGAELQDFINRRSLHRFERTSAGLALDQIDTGLYSDLAAAFGWDDLPVDVDRLQERGLADGQGLTIAGALVLTHPGSSLNLSKAVVEVLRYPDDGTNYDRRIVFDGALQDQVRDASRFIVDELGSDLVVSGLYRYDIPRLPEVVVRETVANAVAHRNYEIDRTSVIVELRPDRVIVRSPGPLPEPVTVETIRRAQASRNPSIIGVLRAFSLAEDAGRGIDVIEDSMRAALLDPPTFVDDGQSVTASLPLRGPITPRERAWVQDLERRGELAVDDRLLVIHAARGEVLTNSTAREVLGTEDRTLARRALQRLRDAGLLRQHGERGSARYSLVEQLAPPAAYRMSPREVEELVVSAAEHQPLTNEIVRELTGLERDQALNLLRQLVRDGRLERIGERRGTRYIPA